MSVKIEKELGKDNIGDFVDVSALYTVNGGGGRVFERVYITGNKDEDDKNILNAECLVWHLIPSGSYSWQVENKDNEEEEDSIFENTPEFVAAHNEKVRGDKNWVVVDSIFDDGEGWK